MMFYAGNWRRNYAPTDFDRKANFEQTFTYELPFGHGHKLLSSGIANAVAGGWKLAGIISAVSGLPFTITAASGTLNTPGTSQTSNLTGKFRKLGGIGADSPWFDPTVFSQPAGCAGQSPCTNPDLGNTGRNQFRGPGYIQDNFSLFKSFSIYRESALELRVDAFQLSNTPQFSNPHGGGPLPGGGFGSITGTVGSGGSDVNGVGGGRVLQGAAKFTF